MFYKVFFQGISVKKLLGGENCIVPENTRQKTFFMCGGGMFSKKYVELRGFLAKSVRLHTKGRGGGLIFGAYVLCEWSPAIACFFLNLKKGQYGTSRHD